MVAQAAAWPPSVPWRAAHGSPGRRAAVSKTRQRASLASPLLFGCMATLLVCGAVADKSLALPLAARALVILLGVALAQPRVALFTLFGLAIFFEPYSPDSNMLAGTYLNQDIASAFAVFGLQFTGFELVQLVALAGVLIGAAVRGYRLEGGQLFGAAM